MGFGGAIQDTAPRPMRLWLLLALLSPWALRTTLKPWFLNRRASWTSSGPRETSLRPFLPAGPRPLGSLCPSFFLAETGSAHDLEAGNFPLSFSFLLCEMGINAA